MALIGDLVKMMFIQPADTPRCGLPFHCCMVFVVSLKLCLYFDEAGRRLEARFLNKKT